MIKPLCLALLSALTLGLMSTAQAETVPVATPAALQQALLAVAPGDVLVLGAGDYGQLDLRGLVMPQDRPVVLRGADDGAVRFSGMQLRDVGGLVLENLSFDYSFAPGDPPHLRPFQIINSRGVTIRGALFDGDVARSVGPDSDGYGTAFGLSVRGSAQVTIEAVEIRGFFRGLVVSESRDLVVRGNDLHDLRMDGMNFAQVEDVLIEGNHIHDFARALASGDHADMIQFWTNGTETPSRDIVIRGNVLNSGGGWWTQSIFMRNELVDQGLAGAGMFYRNVLIEQNVIINAHLHGITVGETDGLIIRNNTVIRNARSEGADDNVALWNPRISVSAAARDVQILRNVVSRIAGVEGQADWVVADNVFVQDQGRLGEGLFYDLAFVAARTGDPQDLGAFSYLPGGPLDGTGIGASRLDGLQPEVP